MKIRTKLFLSYSTVIILIAALVSLGVNYYLKDMIEENVEQELTNVNNSLRNMVETSANVSIRNYLRAVAISNKDILEGFYNQYKRGKLSEKAAREKAGEILLNQTIGKSGYIYCINSEGKVVLHPKSELEGDIVTEFEFIKKQINSKNGYLEYNWKNPGEKTPRPKALYMVYFEPWDWIISASAYKSEFTELVNVNDFKKKVLSPKFFETGYSFVLDQEGNFIIHPKLTGNVYDFKGQNEIPPIEKMKQDTSGIIEYNWKNPGEDEVRSKKVAFGFIPEFDWIVASSSYVSEIYSPLRKIRYLVIAGFIITVILLLVVTYYLSANITKPLKQLMKKLKFASDGNFNTRLEIDKRDETGTLAKYFNEFMFKIKEYENSLKSEIESRKNAEEQALEAKEKAEISDRLKTEFLAQMSHEIRTPVNIIISYVGLLELEYEDEGDTELKENFKVITRAGKRIIRTIDLLLNMSELQTGTYQVIPKKIDLSYLLENLVMDYLNPAQTKGLNLDFHNNAEKSSIFADEYSISQIFEHLIDNAIKYTEEGAVSVKIFNDDSNAIIIEVSDTGIGISEEFMPKLFKPFVQEEQGYTRSYEGNGLGLALVKKYCEMNNVFIEVDSKKDEGTTFTLTFKPNSY